MSQNRATHFLKMALFCLYSIENHIHTVICGSQSATFDFFFFNFNNLSQKRSINALRSFFFFFFFAHVMHTWVPSYNQKLPSIYQIVNGLIDRLCRYYTVYIYTNSSICTHSIHSILVQCTHTVCFCFLFFILFYSIFPPHQVLWLVQSSVKKLTEG